MARAPTSSHAWGVAGISKSERVGEEFDTLTAGAHNLAALSGKPALCVRRVWCIAETTFTVLADHAGTNEAPAVAIPAGTMIDADISAITFTGGPVMVFW